MHRGRIEIEERVLNPWSSRAGDKAAALAVLGPLVLAADLVLLLGREVVLDVERLPDFVGGLALDHVGDGLAADVEEGLDVEVVGGLRHG